MNEPVDVLIIGSGASGAAVAWSLAETRMRILCLEQGGWVKPTDYPTNGRDWEARAYGDFSPSPNIRARPTDYPINEDNSPIKVVNFNGVGGSTIMYAAHFPRLHPSDFRVRSLDGVADDWPVDYKTLEPFFAENDRMMGVSGLAGDPGSPVHEPPMPPVPLGKSGERLGRAMNKLGWHWWPSDTTVATQDYEGRAHCINLGHCTPGCAQGAKASTDITYWPAALRAGVQLRTNCRVREITTNAEGMATGVVYYDADGVEQFQPAEVVIVACNGKLENSRTGWKLATSVGGTTTGERGDRVLIDDANNPATVESDSVRGTTNQWLREVMPDRLNNLKTGVIICLQQRTHEEDATGTLAKYGSGYVWWVVPMEYDPLRDTPVVIRRDDDDEPIQVLRDPRGLDDDGNELEGLFTDEKGDLKVRVGSPMAAAVGTLAWPERFPPDEIGKLKTIKGPYAWAGQYDQSPTIRGGGIIRRDWWRYWSRPAFPDLGTVIVGLDTAIKEAEENDWNAWLSLGAFEGDGGAPNVILTGAGRDKCSLAKLAQQVGAFCYDKKADYLLIEDKARGHDTAAEIKRQFADAPWTTILIPCNGKGSFSGDKVARLHAVSPMFSGDVRKDPISGMDVWDGGMVWEPGKDWSQEVVDEVTSFPRGKHDDWVDVLSMVLSFMRRHGVVLRKVEHDRNEADARMYRRPPGVPYAIGS